MSEELFKFLLSELTVVRVHCRSGLCGGVVEIPIEQLGKMFVSSTCRLCGRPFSDQPSDHEQTVKASGPFQLFAETVKRLNSMKEKVEIEFVIPAVTKKSS